MLIMNESTQNFEQRDDPDDSQAYWAGWMAYVGALNEAGVVRAGGALQAPHTATTVRSP